MKQFFFDIVSAHACSYDFRGHNYCSPEGAAHDAELIAMDLACSETDEWIGSQVQVRTTAGRLLFTAPVTIVV